MSTSPAKKRALVYLGVAAFCLFFYLVYDRFSHGVHSPWMTWLFLWPLVLGFLPCLLFWRMGARLPAPGLWARNLWHTGVAALTVSSALRGIFEIAGTGSPYQVWLLWAGLACLPAAAIVYLSRHK